MKRYDCEVNLGGPILHLVPKKLVSAAEMTVLIALHGDDSLRNIVEHGNDKTVHLEEYDRLALAYDEALIKRLFGPRVRSLRLPDEINLGDLSNVIEDEGEEPKTEAEKKAMGQRVAAGRRVREMTAADL